MRSSLEHNKNYYRADIDGADGSATDSGTGPTGSLYTGPRECTDSGTGLTGSSYTGPGEW